MAEELRAFLRAGLWALIAGGIYLVFVGEAAGTALYVAVIVAAVAFVAVSAAMAPRSLSGLGEGSPLGRLIRAVGFGEPREPDPLHGELEIVPLASPWPIVTAAALVIAGLGLVFGAWLLLPGIALLALGGIGWLTQLNRVG